MFGAAMQAIVLLQKENVLRFAARAFSAIGPTLSHHIFAATDRIGEVNNGVLESGKLHDVSIMRSSLDFVKYIIANLNY